MKRERCEAAGQFGVCPFVTAQRLLSGKWAILILQKLSDGPMRFNQLQREIDITQATLSTHLKRMEEDGLVERTVYPEVPPRVEYALTDIGRSFAPVLDEIETWGNRYIAYLHEKNDTRLPHADTAAG